MEPVELLIRRMKEDDIDQVWQIEKDLFSLPWPKTSFLCEVSSAPSFSIVGVLDGLIAGYAVAWFVVDEIHIGNLAVARSWQGRGIGKRLLEFLLREAARRKTSIATLEVRVSNVRAINMYRSFGFKGVAIRKRYYTDTGEDALVMLAAVAKGDAGGPGAESASR
jgi:ribosomal-protein-alanine N-acetyltransferase